MVSKKELAGYSVDELEKFIQSADKDLQKIKEDKARAHAILDEKNREAEALRLVETMGDEERAALMQVLQTAPIATEEAVGEP